MQSSNVCVTLDLRGIVKPKKKVVFWRHGEEGSVCSSVKWFGRKMSTGNDSLLNFSLSNEYLALKSNNLRVDVSAFAFCWRLAAAADGCILSETERFPALFGLGCVRLM